MSDPLREVLDALRAERRRIDTAIAALEALTAPAARPRTQPRGTISRAVIDLVVAEPGITTAEVTKRLRYFSTAVDPRRSLTAIRRQLVKSGTIDQRGSQLFPNESTLSWDSNNE